MKSPVTIAISLTAGLVVGTSIALYGAAIQYENLALGGAALMIACAVSLLAIFGIHPMRPDSLPKQDLTEHHFRSTGGGGPSKGC